MNLSSSNRFKKWTALLISIAVTIIACISTIYFYEKRLEPMISKEDTGFIYSLIILLLGITATIANIMRYTSKETITTTSSEKVKKLAQAALFTALCYIGFQYFRFDIPVGTEKTAIHFGNTFCVLAALLLGGTWGGLAGAVGMTIADLTSSYVTSAPKTFFLKLCIGLIVGFVAHKILHLSKERTNASVLRITVIASISGMAFNVVADPLVGYFYKKYLFGIQGDIAQTLAKISAGTTLVNAVTSVVIATFLYTSLRPALIKANLFSRLEKK